MNRKRYLVEFLISVYEASVETLRGCLFELGEELNLEEEDNNGKGKIVRVKIYTDEPHLVFDACSQFGRLKSVKVSEINDGSR